MCKGMNPGLRHCRLPGDRRPTFVLGDSPSIAGIRSLSLFVYFEAAQDPYAWDYILDARSGCGSGWFSFLSAPSLSVGSCWTKWVMHDLASGARSVNPNPLVLGKWLHLYLEASSSFTDDLRLLARYAPAGGGWEDAHAKLVSFSLWDRALTDAEIDTLAAGGAASWVALGASLLASYNADDASLTSGTLGDSSGQQGDGTIYSTDTGAVALLTSAAMSTSLPSCVPRLTRALPQVATYTYPWGGARTAFQPPALA